MRVINKLYKDWSPSMKARLRSLSLRSAGDMCKIISNKVCDTFVILDETIIGWSIYVLEPWYSNSPGDFMLYVRSSYRRMGWGRKLVELAINKYGSLKIHLWNECSGKFYSKMYFKEFTDKLDIVRGSNYLYVD